jgi:hypothetical protein
VLRELEDEVEVFSALAVGGRASRKPVTVDLRARLAVGIVSSFEDLELSLLRFDI